MTNNLPPEVRSARELLRRVSVAPDAEARVYWNVMAASKQRSLFGLRFSAVTAGMLLSASAALGFGVASRIERPFRAVAPLASIVAATTAPKPHPPRRLSRGVEVPTTLQEDADAAVIAQLPDDPTAASVDEREAPLELGVGAARSRPMGESVSGPIARTSPSPGSTIDPSAGLPANPSPGSTNAVALKSVPPSPELGQPSELGQQVADYHGAVCQLPADPAVALTRLEAFRRKWPSSALLHEVDLRIVQALVALGRSAEASRAAKRFLVRYPESARAAEVRRIADATQSDNATVD